MHRTRVVQAGAFGAYALLGEGPSYRVRWSAPDSSGPIDDTEIVAIPPSASPAPSPAPAAGGAPPAAAAATPAAPSPGAASPAVQADDAYRYRTIDAGKVGVIDYRRCEDLGRFKVFLDTTFAAIQAAPVRALIIDIRGNGGGNSALNDLLWTYVSDKPFKQFGGVIVKACDRLKREYGHDKYVEIYGDEAWNAPNGMLLRFGTDPNSDLIVPGPLALRFRGPVYLLISAETFSSAMSCALAAKDFGLATIVGEATGEPVDSTGEIYTLRAPATGLRAFLTTKVFLPPKPHPPGQGVVPDVVVPTTLADVAAKRDPVLQATLAMIARA
jgi:hypothetical protein